MKGASGGRAAGAAATAGSFLRVSLMAAIVLSIAAPALAAGGERPPLSSDRPDFTESGQTVPSGAVQLEAGATFADLDGGGEILDFGEILLRIGLGERWELRLGTGHYVEIETPGEEIDGLTDASVGFKVRLDDPEGEGASYWALIVDSTLDTGDEEIGADDPQPGAKLIFARALTDGLDLAANANWKLADQGDDKFDQFSASLSLAFGLAERLGGYFELYGFSEEFEGGPSSSYANTGVTYLLRPELQLDARVGHGLGGTPVDLFFGLGVVKRW